MSSEKITISVPEDMKKKLVEYAHEENMSLSKFLSSYERYTYLSMHSSGKVKIGISKTPIKRGSIFGTVFAILPSQKAESILLSKLQSTEPPSELADVHGKTEWVVGDMDSIFFEIEQLGIGILNESDIVNKGRNTKTITLDLSLSEYESLKKITEKFGISMTQLIRSMINENTENKV